MKDRIVFFVFVSILFMFIGCGENLEPGEEVVSNKWKVPKDMGKDYPVGDIKVGDTVYLNTGERHVVKENDIIKKEREGVVINIDGKSAYRFESQVMIVPDDLPIVSFTRSFKKWTTIGPFHFHEPIPKDENVEDYVIHDFSISIDRRLDYNLPIYLEYQAQKRDELGGEVIRVRYLAIVTRGRQWAYGTTPPGNENDYQRSSISILPYTEMNDIDLPAKAGSTPELFDEIRLPDAVKVIPKGHKFRPYRIRSSSFRMGEIDLSEGW